MSVNICAIASESNGNCYYIGTENEAIIVDLGISKRNLLKRISKLKIPLTNIKAIFVSHAHVDHIKGVEMFSKYYNIPVYCTQKNYSRNRFTVKPELLNLFNANDYINLGKFKIKSFLKSHDCVEPCSFNITIENKTVGVYTDIGIVDNILIEHFKLCDAVFLETNYDEALLLTGKYPDFLKKRVHSDKGHLSNEQAYKLITNYATPKLKHVFFSHISEDNNKTEFIWELFEPLKDKINFYNTYRYNAGKLLMI